MMTELQATELLEIMARVEFMLYAGAFLLALIVGYQVAQTFLNAIRNRTEL